MTDVYGLYAAFTQTDTAKVNKRDATITVNGVTVTINDLLQLVWWLIDIASDTSAIDELIDAISSVHPDMGKVEHWEDAVAYLVEKLESEDER